MRPYARVRAGRVVALGLRVWLRRCVQIHAVAALCLAIFFIVPGMRGEAMDRGNPIADERLVGISGLFPTAWVVAFEFLLPGSGEMARNVVLAYLGQFAVTAIIVRDAHRHLAGRVPRCGVAGFFGLALLAAGGLALFAAIDGVAAAGSQGAPLGLLLVIAATVAEIFLAGGFWLALPAAGVDNRGIFSAIGRSFFLSRGSRSSLAVVVLMLVLQQWLILLPLGLLGRALGLHAPPDWLVAVPMIVFLTLKACFVAAAYHEAGLRKEGGGVEDVSEVFA